MREKQLFASHQPMHFSTVRTKSNLSSSLHPESAALAKPSSGFTSSEISKSASQDELGRLTRSPSLLRLNATAEEGPPSHSQLEDQDHLLKSLGPLAPPSPIDFAEAFSSSPSKFSNSPILASSPFETVQEEQESSDADEAQEFFEAKEKEDPYQLAELELAA